MYAQREPLAASTEAAPMAAQQLTEPGRAYLGRIFHLKQAVEPWERAAQFALRREVFCIEQRMFKGDDRDAIDDDAIALVAVASSCGIPDEVVGTVRIHQPDPGLWYGSRLAVAPRYRRSGGLGAALIRLAVGTAHARGCTTFLAHVQAKNVTLFTRLYWETLERMALHDHPHALMRALLAHHPPIADPFTGFHVLGRKTP